MALRQSLIASRVASLQDDMTTARALLNRLSATPARGRVLCTTPAGVTLAGRTVAMTIAVTSGHTVAVVVYDRALAQVAQAPPTAVLPRLDPSQLQTALGGSRTAAQIVSGAGSQDQLVVGFPVRTAANAGAVCGVAQLSTSTASIDRVLGDEVALLAIGSAGALLLALLAGVLLTGRALRPLQRLTQTSQRLAAGDLRARSGVLDRDDEVGTLALSFDEMASRIEELFTAQQVSEERTRRFIADASHELRTPVTALKGYIDVIRRGATPDPATLAAALDAMAREAERMRVLVLDLLTLARLDARNPGVAAPQDVSAAVARLLDEGVPGMPDDVRRDLAPHVVAMAGDNALPAVIRNLLVNACKYAPGALQEWRTWTDGARAHLAVRDHGPGIAAHDLPHVFERFYRGEKTRAREEGGSGLGLSIVKAIAESQGGGVEIESVEGAGTTVSVWLPAAPTGRQPAPPPPPPPSVRG